METTNQVGTLASAAKDASPLSVMNSALTQEVGFLQDEIDLLFNVLRPLLSPEAPTDSGSVQKEPSNPRSEQVSFMGVQVERLSSSRSRLEYLRSLLEV